MTSLRYIPPHRKTSWMNKKFFYFLSIMVCVNWQSWSQDFQVTFDDEPSPVKQEITEVKENTFTGSDTIRIQLIEKAKEYLGVSYRYGQSNENGFDCSGFVRFVYSNFGYTLPHSSSAQYKESRHIKDRKAKPGDLVFFVTTGNQISHVGIYLGDDTFIHSPSRGKKVIIDSLDAEYYKQHLAGFGSFLDNPVHHD
jgi:cell wall-associated NlpC family hydrolase